MIEVRTNLPNFSRQLATIKDDLKKRAIRSATGSAAKVIKEKAIALAPVSSGPHMLRGKRIVMPGYLKKNIYNFMMKGRPGLEHFKVSVRGGKSAKTVTNKKKGTSTLLDAYYWRWVHEGHVVGKVRGGKRTKALGRERLRAQGKFVRGQPFLRTSFQQANRQAVDAFYAKLDVAIRGYNSLK